MNLTRNRAGSLQSVAEHEKTRYPQLMRTAGKASGGYRTSLCQLEIDSHPLWLDMVDMVLEPEWGLQ